MAESREDLIYSLARSMGMGETNKTPVKTAGKYSAETGTIFSNGHVIKRETIEQAKQYFDGQYRKLCEMDDDGARQMACIYEVAVEAIRIMVDTNNE